MPAYRPAPSFLDAFSATLTRHYADFQGRARRSEYWYFQLANVLLSLAMQAVSSFLTLTAVAFENEVVVGALFGLTTLLSSLVSLGLLVPGVCVGIRRLHDTGRSGWWMLLWLIPCVGWIVLIVFYCEDSQRGGNAWGPNPKWPEDNDVLDHLETGRAYR